MPYASEQGWLSTLWYLPLALITLLSVRYALIAVLNPQNFIRDFPLESEFSGAPRFTHREIYLLIVSFGFILIWLQIFRFTISFVPETIFIPHSYRDAGPAFFRTIVALLPALFLGPATPGHLERIARALTNQRDD